LPAKKEKDTGEILKLLREG